ncbi:MAG: V-type ATP synthase subunit E family protein [Candidatus Wallbacteria bacterium]|nr:V-type ATP synthase subunit E family protein [Candidatus Wallbacteria bacterium]
MKTSEKIAYLTKEIMEKAEDRAEDVVVSAETEAELLVQQTLELMLKQHRQRRLEAYLSFKRDSRKLVSAAEYEVRKAQLFYRLAVTKEVRAKFLERCAMIHKNREIYFKLLCRILDRSLAILGEKKIIVTLDQQDKDLKERLRGWILERQKDIEVSIEEEPFGFGVRLYDSERRKVVDSSLEAIIISRKETIKSIMENYLRKKYE